MKINEKRARETVNAVYDDNFESFLKQLGVYEEVIQGRSKCKFCGNSVDYDHIATVFADSGDIKFVCDKPECVVKLSEYLSNK